MGEIFIGENITQHEEEAGPARTSLSDDSSYYFDPCAGNVIFASATDGWGFDLNFFAQIYAKKSGVSTSSLTAALFGDFYISAKDRRIKPDARKHGRKPLFVQLILDNLWRLYDTLLVLNDKEMFTKLMGSLGVNLTPRDLRTTDSRLLLQVAMSQWIPLSKAALNLACAYLPSPKQLPPGKIERLMCPAASLDSLPEESRCLKSAFEACSSEPDVPVIVFISKMFAVDYTAVPENKMRRRRENDAGGDPNRTNGETNGHAIAPDADSECPDVEFIAFARVYSGEIKKGQSLYVLPPSYNPATDDGSSIERVTVARLYLLMGRELDPVLTVPAGNVVGIGGLQDAIFKSGTLSSTLSCPAFSGMEFYSDAIVRVAIEPVDPTEMPLLLKGLKLLSQADPCVRTFIQETGEHVIVTSGEVHLERCVKDLMERYSKLELNVSDPIVPFMETIVEPRPPPEDQKVEVKQDKLDFALVHTATRRLQLRIKAQPIPPAVVDILEKYSDLLLGAKGSEITGMGDQDDPVQSLKAELSDSMAGPCSAWLDKTLSFGPKRAPLNMLVCLAENYECATWFTRDSTQSDFALGAIHGFHMACLAGPICREPLRGVAFVIEDIVAGHQNDPADGMPDVDAVLSGQLIAALKDGCVKAFQVTGEEMLESSNLFKIKAMLPVCESFGFAEEMRKKTSGHAWPQLSFSHWEVIDLDPFWLPTTEDEIMDFTSNFDNVAHTYMNNVRRRKGLKTDEQVVAHAEKQRTLGRNV